MWSVQIFLFQYNNPSNYKISQNENIFGCKDGKGGLKKKFYKLKKGALIIIRDSSSKPHLKFFGYCVVNGQPYDQIAEQLDSPPDQCWEDEKEKQKLIYPLRVKVDFKKAPMLENFYNITWDDLLVLGMENKKGKKMGKPGLGKFFSGNFVPESSLGEFYRVLGLRNQDWKPVSHTVDQSNLKEIGDAGEKFIYNKIKKEFRDKEYKVNWKSRLEPYSPYDIEVSRKDETIIYIEVKATTKINIDGCEAFISKNELEWRRLHKKKHRLYLIVFGNGIKSEPTMHTLLTDDAFTLEPIKYRLRLK